MHYITYVFLCNVKVSIKSKATEAAIPIHTDTYFAIFVAWDLGLNSPHVGTHNSVLFSSKKNPSEQFSILLLSPELVPVLLLTLKGSVE